MQLFFFDFQLKYSSPRSKTSIFFPTVSPPSTPHVLSVLSAVVLVIVWARLVLLGVFSHVHKLGELAVGRSADGTSLPWDAVLPSRHQIAEHSVLWRLAARWTKRSASFFDLLSAATPDKVQFFFWQKACIAWITSWSANPRVFSARREHFTLSFQVSGALKGESRHLFFEWALCNGASQWRFAMRSQSEHDEFKWTLHQKNNNNPGQLQKLRPQS